jgi:hypothetical protein
MKKQLFQSVLPFGLMVFALFFMSKTHGQPLSPRIANYDISVSLDPGEKLLDGDMWLSWTNASMDTIFELQFHMYLNAFKNTESTFWKDSGGQLRGASVNTSDPKVWGWVDILEMETRDGHDLTPNMRFIQPDDQNRKDQSVLAVELDEPVFPGSTLDLNIRFQSKLPRIFARTGYSGDFFLVAQWFPKIGVYEPAGMRYAETGQWNCHQFHGNSEFYANFGVYKVDITIPAEYTVGATGMLTNKTDHDNGTKTLSYIAEDVVDFAWTASPVYMVHEDQWRDVQIRVYLQPEHYYMAKRHSDAVKAALEYFDQYLGPYPYPIISIVDPPIHGMGAGGMEYPMFITAGSVWGLPEEVRATEMVTIHEFGHNYFMGILATNEFEEAWMDEGMNSYFEARIMDHTYGETTSFVGARGFHFGDVEYQRLAYTASGNPKIAESYRNAWEYPHGGYGTMSYNKPATMLGTLERLVGEDTMNEIMMTYFDRWKFKHPCTNDFIDIVNEVVTARHGNTFGDQLDWFFDPFLYGSDICDYKARSIRNQKLEPPEGIHEVSGNKMTYKEIEYESTLYRSRVILDRLGEVVMPVEVLVTFDNGDEILEKWWNNDRTMEFAYERPEKIVSVQVDPEHKILMDVNFQNNGLTVDPDHRGLWKLALKFFFLLQNALMNVSLFT